ncbi:hypothetical protein EV189_1162 [Motilibacter rhizosphaerae]|uniref:PH domain-containing protein n=1 Tax=Motilibacter rhizosphaerae TaxID=598652 RepID=A0A4V2F4I1_9ACTN|nr:hypothetical protein [Motilibacter rhizosphaerae]RZS89399.1 hypothetical protein EV189_1162 [Motilibacter rhizosphaerae]
MTLLAAPHSAPTTHLGERLGWTALVLVLLALAYLLMWRGWKARARRQSDVPELAAVPPAVARGPQRARSEGTYVVTTTAGDWLDRIVAHGLGERSLAHLAVHESGVLFSRVGAPDLFVPAAALRGARLERGMAGKFVEEGGLVVVTWQHGDRLLDTGFRPRAAADRDALVAAVESLAGAAR